jgi:CRP-like cAMP-binding protein
LLFAQLTDTQADRQLAGQIGLDVVAEQVLLLQQDEGEGLLVIQTGLAKVRAYTANGEEAVMAVLGPGDLMGEMAVLRALSRRFLLRGGDASTRLLAALLDLALSCSRGQDPLALIPPLPQRELAAMAGLSRQTISRTFTQLRERGMVIGDPQGMRIVDLQCLRKRGLLA